MLHYTHALLTEPRQWSAILGVRRESVTEAAGKLQKVGAIAYRRGKITAIDRILLERLCCECYAVVRKETDRLSRCRSPLTNPVMSRVPAEIVVPPNGSRRARSPQFQLRRARPRGSACSGGVAAGWCARERLVLWVGVAPIGSRYLL